jgi:hypothetical protein
VQRRLQAVVDAAKTAEVAAWIIGALAVLFVVTWHDAMVKPYWDQKYAKGSLFLTQGGFRLGPRPADRAPEPVESYALWLSIMRYEADVSVGLLAASAGVVMLTAARHRKDRRSWSGPGAVACLTAVGAMGLCALEEASLGAKGSRGLWRSTTDPFPNAWPQYELRIGLAVLGAWVVLIGARLWRVRGEWADRFGVIIGTLWICLIIYRITACAFIPFGNWRL